MKLIDKINELKETFIILIWNLAFIIAWKLKNK